MGISGGGGTKSYSGSAQKWAKPYAKAAAAETQSVYNNAEAGLNNITGQVQGAIPGIYAKYQAGNPVLNAASSYDTHLLGRDPFAGSSQLENLINISRGHALDAVGAKYGSHGSFGGTPWAAAAAKGAMEAETGLRYGDAQNIMQMQQQASAGAPQKAAADYLGITPFLQAASAGATIPYTGIESLDQGLAALFNGSKSVTKGPSLLSQLSGAAGNAAGAYAAGG